jgi:YD repeat-containing protein
MDTMKGVLRIGLTRKCDGTTGNLTSDGTNQYAYDALGRLEQATTNSATVAYRVSAQGERIRKDGVYYHYDAQGRLIGESDASGTIQWEYLWLDSTPVAIIE